LKKPRFITANRQRVLRQLRLQAMLAGQRKRPRGLDRLHHGRPQIERLAPDLKCTAGDP